MSVRGSLLPELLRAHRMPGMQKWRFSPEGERG